MHALTTVALFNSIKEYNKDELNTVIDTLLDAGIIKKIVKLDFITIFRFSDGDSLLHDDGTTTIITHDAPLKGYSWRWINFIHL